MNLPSNSPLVSGCRDSQQRLQSAIDQWFTEVNKFNEEVGAATSRWTLQASSQTKIGAAAAVQGTIYWVTSKGTRVPVKTGTPLFLNAHVISEENSRMQVLLLDETVFTLGPNSDMVLDEFVYDPNTNTGKIVASVIKGTFRFVTGKLARKDPEQMKVKLAVGDLGFRGTDGEVYVSQEGSGYIKLFSGRLDITPAKAGSKFVLNAGEMVSFSGVGEFGLPGKIP